MGRSVFLDTSAWFAVLSPRDAWHDAALRAYTESARSGILFVTTTLVVAEVHSLVLRWRDPAVGQRFLDGAFASPQHAIVAPDVDLTQEAIGNWIHGYPGQSFTICDAVSFEVMSRERLTHALAFDRHFTIAGYECVAAH